MEEIRKIYNKPSVLLEGVIEQKGKGWIFIREDIEPYNKEIKTKNDEGLLVKEKVEVNPFKTLICFPHTLGEKLEKDKKFKADVKLIFSVTPQADMNKKTNKIEVKYWLNDVYTVDEYLDSLAIVNEIKK